MNDLIHYNFKMMLTIKIDQFNDYILQFSNVPMPNGF